MQREGMSARKLASATIWSDGHVALFVPRQRVPRLRLIWALLCHVQSHDLRRVALPATHADPSAMFSVTKPEASAIRGAFHHAESAPRSAGRSDRQQVQVRPRCVALRLTRSFCQSRHIGR
jgi:hypothetical protein